MGKTGSRTLRKGIVGIEAAIVMIAFVIVAAALAFVVLNMGFFTTQQSRQVMQRGLGESSSALMVDGTVVAAVDTANARVNYVFAPIKLSTGQYIVDLTPGKSIVGYWSPQKGIAIANTYLMAILTPVDTPATIADALSIITQGNYYIPTTINTNVAGSKGEVKIFYLFKIANITKTGQVVSNIYWFLNTSGTFSVPSGGYTTVGLSSNPSVTIKVNGTVLGPIKVAVGLPDDVSSPGLPLYKFLKKFTGGEVVTVMTWVTKVNEDIVLDPGEKVLMLTYYANDAVKPQSYDTLKLEVRVPIGAPLTIERSIPPSLTQGIVDLG